MKAKAGHIVILSNPSLKGLLKICSTSKGIEDALRELNEATDLPSPFETEKSFLVAEPEGSLSRIHELLARYRVSGQKDYFSIDLEQAVETIIHHCKEIGYLYVLSNPGFQEGLLKIGSTRKDMIERLRELNSPDSVPTPFKIEACFEVEDPLMAEERVLDTLKEFRVSDKKFFLVDPEKAVSVISQICGTEPANLKDTPPVDQELLATGKALRAWDRALEKDPKDRHAILERARALFKLGNNETAIEDLSRLIRLNPDDALACVAHIERGQVYLNDGEYEKAVRDFDRALSLKPDREWSCVVFFTRGRAHQALGHHQEAAADYGRMIALKPDDDEWICVAHIERGRAYYSLGEYQKAISDYNRAIELNPDNEWAPIARVERGQVYYALGDYEKAINDYDKTAELKRDKK